MKVIIAPDSFKGTLTAPEVCEIVAREFRAGFPGADIVSAPLADGGEGMAAAWQAACGGTMQSAEVSGPYNFPGREAAGAPVRAPWLLLENKTAVLEMASCAGLELARPYGLDPGRASTRGVGELIQQASRHASRAILGLGGSATNDAGAGMACALGWEFLNRAGKAFCPTGSTLCEIMHIIPPKYPLLYEDSELYEVVAACDVGNPLYGTDGAAYVYAPQKGADAATVRQLDDGLRHIAGVMGAEPLARTPGAGAAGGLGFGVLAFLKGTLRPGIDLLLEQMRFSALLHGADWVITGEGRMDSQTLQGKAPMGVLPYAKAARVPVIGICGCLGEGADKLYEAGFAEIFPASAGGLSLQALQNTCRRDLANAAKQAAQYIANCG